MGFGSMRRSTGRTTTTRRHQPVAGPEPAARPTRKRAQLDREVILQAALDLSSRGRPITFRALGSALGADPTAVYRHFRDKNELVGAAFDRLLQDVIKAVDPAGSWRDRLRASATLTLDACEAHPSIGVEARSLITRGPGELAAVELLLEQFQAAGLDQAQAVRFYAAYSSYLLAVSATAATLRLESKGEVGTADTSWIGDVGPVDPARYPAVAAARTELATLRDRDVFMMGIEVLLDAAEAAAHSAHR
jgi:AcrR family transcriptional regulator